MAGHRLGGAEDELLGPVAEHSLYGRGLRGVAVRRRRPVRVDVADLTGLDPPVAHGEAHRLLGSGAVGRRGRDVVCVRGLAEAHDLGVDLRAAAPRVAPLLDDPYPRAVAYPEPV